MSDPPGYDGSTIIEDVFLAPLRRTLNGVGERAAKHEHRWTDRDDAYWLQRLMQEVGELASVLAGDHDDTVEHELEQIASIAVNWLRRRGTPDSENES